MLDSVCERKLCIICYEHTYPLLAVHRPVTLHCAAVCGLCAVQTLMAAGVSQLDYSS